MPTGVQDVVTDQPDWTTSFLLLEQEEVGRGHVVVLPLGNPDFQVLLGNAIVDGHFRDAVLINDIPLIGEETVNLHIIIIIYY